MKQLLTIIMTLLTVIIITKCSNEDGGGIPLGGGVGGSGSSGTISTKWTDDYIGSIDDGSNLTAYDAFYAGLGTKVGSYTPTKFKIPITDMAIFENMLFGAEYQVDGLDLVSINEAASENFNGAYADFTNDVTKSIGTLSEGMNIDSVLWKFPQTTKMLAFQYIENDARVKWRAIEPEIVVEIPGYTDADLSDHITSVTQSFPNVDENGDPITEVITYYKNHRKYLGSNEFQFDIFKIASTSPASGMYEAFYFGNNVVDYDLMYDYIQGIDAGIELNSLRDIWYQAMLRIPMESTSVTYGESATIIISVELENILELYDNNTPADKSDDILVLAKNYWAHFKVTVVK